ncbi:MAG: ubiquinone biosynthesis accessory factor UbiJ [Gammaproteobacteria bacterium]
MKPPMIGRAIFLSLLENAISRYLALDPDAGQLLKPISGKVIAIRIRNPDWTFYLCPSDRTIQLLESYEGRPDTTLTGTPLAFFNLGLAKNPSSVLFAGEVVIEGDVSTGRRFQSVFKQLDIDWEEQLSHLTGDIPAHGIGNLVRGTLRWGQRSLEALRLDITEYLQEERRVLPSRYECNEWFKDVDAIRANTDRLEMRVKRLANQLPEDP